MTAVTVSSSRRSSTRARSAAVSGASLANSSASMICVNRIRSFVLPTVKPEIRKRLTLPHGKLAALRQLQPRQQRDHAMQLVLERRQQPGELDTRYACERVHDQPDLLLQRDRPRGHPVLFRTL